MAPKKRISTAVAMTNIRRSIFARSTADVVTGDRVTASLGGTPGLSTGDKSDNSESVSKETAKPAKA
jgi:hypothetical protein